MRIANASAKRISAAEAAGLVKSGMWLDFGATLCQPDMFDAALAARASELSDAKTRSCLSVRSRAFLEADPEGEHFHAFNWHFGGYDRAKHDAGRCTYIPLNLGEVPDYYRRFIDPVDIVVLKACPMDENGFFNFGPTNAWHRALVERSRVVILETSPAMPYVFGEHNGVHVSEVDYTNMPHIIMQNEKMVSINNTTQIDLQGQATSESDGHRHLTGTGGQLQFVRGANASKGGKSFM